MPHAIRLVAALLLGLLLTACGGGGRDTTEEPEPSTCTVRQCTSPR